MGPARRNAEDTCTMAVRRDDLLTAGQCFPWRSVNVNELAKDNALYLEAALGEPAVVQILAEHAEIVAGI
jgi:hypothetical protein